MVDIRNLSKEKQSEILSNIKNKVDYMDSPTNPDGTPSPCALQCMAQQQALVDCINEIRDDLNNDKTKKCLEPSLGAWTTCCSEANTFAGVDPTRPS